MTQNYSTGDIHAIYVAVGNKATAMSPDPESARIQALQELRSFIALLPAYEHVLGKPVEVRADAIAAEAALSKKSMNRGRLEKLVRKIALGVTGVTALADAVSAVQAAIAHL